MEEYLRVHIGFKDHILFQPASSHEALHSVREGLVVGKITTAAYPMASQANMVELISQDDITIDVEKSGVFDIAHVVPLLEVESGL
jgi:hypothetical protein